MEINNHRLDGAQFTQSPNQGGTAQARYVVIHFTGATTLSSTVNHFTNPLAKASSHLVIDRDGTVAQMVAFDRVAWHAGRSRWRGLEGLNAHSLGIELVNAGRVTPRGKDYASDFGTKVAAADVIEATHQHESRATFWQIFPPEQIESCIEVCQALRAAYPAILDVIGHDDIAPGRKTDPGPAFPMEAFRAAVMGRDGNEEPALHVATTRLNLRAGPGTHHAMVLPDPLAAGTRMIARARAASWVAVEVLDLQRKPFATGWVHGDYLKPVSA